jgi:hypothetical protein
MKIAFLLLIATVAIVGAMVPPIFDYDSVAPYYKEFTGNDMPVLMNTVRGESSRLYARETTPIPTLLNVARRLCGRGPRVFLNDVQRLYPSFWQESRGSSSYVSVFETPNEELLPGEPFLRATGVFNTTLICDPVEGCFIFNRRTTEVFIIPFNITLPTTIDVALFVFSDTNCRTACGFDDALAGNGYYGNSSQPLANIPIFNSVLNLQGILTADAFSTADINSGVGADAGWGSNKYVPRKNLTDRTYQNTIFSTFDSPDPATGIPVLLGRQVTINQGQIGVAPF